MKYPIEIKGKTQKQVTKINLSGHGLKEFPQNIFEYTNLTKLVLSNNQIKVIPKDILKLKRLKVLDLANNDIWLGLAKYAIQDGNYTMATTYLNNSYYIDENNFKYYYYLSQLLRAKGDNEMADLSLIRCADINAEYEAAMRSGYSEYYGK